MFLFMLVIFVLAVDKLEEDKGNSNLSIFDLSDRDKQSNPTSNTIDNDIDDSIIASFSVDELSKDLSRYDKYLVDSTSIEPLSDYAALSPIDDVQQGTAYMTSSVPEVVVDTSSVSNDETRVDEVQQKAPVVKQKTLFYTEDGYAYYYGNEIL